MSDLEQLVLSISADTRQMQRALQKLTGDTKTAADQVDAAFTKSTPKIDAATKSVGAMRFQTANLAAQFQDIAVQLQGGASPFTVALQQGTQINQVLGQAGATGVVGLLGSAFKSLITPTSLATIGIIALGGAAVQYGAKAIGAVDDLDAKLKTHADLIKSLKDAYGEAGKGVDVAVKEATATLKTFVGLSSDALQKPFKNMVQGVVTATSSFETLGDAAGITIRSTAKKFSAFTDPIDKLREGLKAGTPDVVAFRREVAAIADATNDPGVRKKAQELKDMTDAALQAQLTLESGAKALRNFGSAALAAAQQGEEFTKAIKTLAGTVTPNLSDREKIMKNYNDALVKAGSTEERLAAQRAKDDQLAILSYNDRKKSAEDMAKEAESAAKRFQSAINSTLKHTQQTKGATPAIGCGALAFAMMENY